MPNCEIKLSARFIDDVQGMASVRVAQHARRLLASLATFPDMGRASDSPTLTVRFGPGIRTLVCGNYLLVYTHNENTVEALALYPARRVR